MASVPRAGDAFPVSCTPLHTPLHCALYPFATKRRASWVGEPWRHGRRVSRCQGYRPHAAATLHLFDSRNAALGRAHFGRYRLSRAPSNVEPPWSGASAPCAACSATHELVARASRRLTSLRFAEHRPWARPFRGRALSRAPTVSPSNFKATWWGAAASCAPCCPLLRLAARIAARLHLPDSRRRALRRAPFPRVGASLSRATSRQRGWGAAASWAPCNPLLWLAAPHSRDVTSLGSATQDPSARPFRGWSLSRAPTVSPSNFKAV